ncbi:cora superfamily [Pleurotus ostreatus PC15]|uniref:Cora superfamily n=1 Tax=Pleurotus ostreatus (strain PC15) TaxID=1137138 RepID=A0A067NX91_PLEO1|nr:cora superfamily [Pleurotus ostreatus PC15]
MSSDPQIPSRPQPEPLQPRSPRHDDSDDDDVYRGDHPPFFQPLQSVESLAESSSSSSSSSSSFSFPGRGRLGAIATVVEHAISRWARRRSSSSSSGSSDSSSSTDSIVTLSRSQFSGRRRRHRRRSNANLRSVQSLQSDLVMERTITDLKAREELRQVPRGFALYLPPPLRRHSSRAGVGSVQPVTRTTSLSLITTRLDLALKKTTKEKRRQGRPRVSLPQQGLGVPSAARGRRPRGTPHAGGPQPSAQRRHGKDRHGQTPGPRNPLTPLVESSSSAKAWWLDVANPDWEDIRAIGRLLHLHPLTLEDIFQQEPREKLEFFSRLGYYFLVFRAIESQATQEKIQRADLHHGQSGGIVGEAIVYLVVFEEGICTFHFADASEHINRVINRILLLEEVTNMSSDWIAHGMLDSVVDSFFPVLEKVEQEVSEIEKLVFFPQEATGPPTVTPPSSQPPSTVGSEDEKFSKASSETPLPILEVTRPTQIRFSLRLNPRLMYRRLKRFIRARWSAAKEDDMAAQTYQKPSPLQRMARTRRLVTTLTRLLGSKSEVVSQMRKRLLNGSGTGIEKGDDDVAIYIGDVQDHILSLQHSLAHYERMLSQSHPAYLVQLRTNLARARSGSDAAIFYLTIVTIGVLCLQVLFGAFSLNVEVPGNVRNPEEPFTVFGEMIAVSVVIICAYLANVRRWYIRAKKRRTVL